MKKLILTVLTAGALLAASNPAAEKEVLAALDTWRNAVMKRDRAAYDKILHPDLTYAHSNGAVETKDVFGGTMYAAPRRLSATRPNELDAVVDTMAFATDGSFFPDGRRYVLRDYGNAAVYSYPGHERLASFRLPSQQQGEGIAVAEDGSVHVNTEGQFSEVLQVSPLTAWSAATAAARFVARAVGLLLGHGAAA